tara:strand:- start:8 stop:511 length:504 start_codon:yes stop_codon:yes gene_type:complete
VHQPGDLKVVRQLEAQNRIVNISAIDPVNVFSRRILICILEIARYAPTSKDGAQVYGPAEFFASFIQPPPKAVAAVFRVNEYIQPIKGITFRVVPDLFVPFNQIVISMRVAESLIFNRHGERDGNELAFVFNADLAIRELFNQCLDGVLWPGAANMGSAHETEKIVR